MPLIYIMQVLQIQKGTIDLFFPVLTNVRTVFQRICIWILLCILLFRLEKIVHINHCTRNGNLPL